MKTCNRCGMCEKKTFQKASLFIGLSLGAVIGVLLCAVVMCIKAVV